MLKNGKLTKFLLIILIVSPVVIVSGLFFPDVQKYIVKNHLTPWIANAQVDYIHITPFSIRIDSLSFKYEAIDIQIDHLESEFSPFSLLERRIKIDKFILNPVQVHDASIAQKDKPSATLLFPGLFPYLDSNFIFDIGLLDIRADYYSSTTGLVEIALSAQAVNEFTSNPLKLLINAKELTGIPDIQGITVDGSITLQQHSGSPIDAKKSLFDIRLINHQGIKQNISIQLAMKQLAAPERWDSFPFDKHRSHYLQELLHPESIQLKIKHTSQEKLLSDIQFEGRYDGNEGIISGKTKIFTAKEFSHTFKTLQLPGIESRITATINYNTRLLLGDINVIDDFKIEHYSSILMSEKITSESSSLPEKIDISNQLIASLDENKLVINKLLVNILSGDQEYIKILAHKPISIDLNNLPEFLEQDNSDLMSITINQLPLVWLNDFIPEHSIKNGYFDADINLEIINKTLKLTSNRPVSLQQITLLKNIKALNKEQTLLNEQNLETDFVITINKDQLNAHMSKLHLFQHNKDKLSQQISSELTFNLKNPLSENAVNNPFTINTRGNIDIHALIKIPAAAHEINSLLNKASTTLEQSLPKALALNYDFSLKGDSSTWVVNKSHIKLSKSTAKKKTTQSILKINNTQAIHLKPGLENIELITTGKLLSAQINQFDFNWLSPFVQQFASPYQFSGQLKKLDIIFSAQGNDAYQFAINQLKFSQLESSLLHQGKKKQLFKDININSKLLTHYSDDNLTVDYPLLTITKKNTSLIKNSGRIKINHLGNSKKQTIVLNGKINGAIHRLMNLSFIKQLTSHTLNNQSLLDANYNLSINNNKLTVNKSEFQILHPQSKGRLILTTLEPISLSLNSKKHNFSQHGHLSFKLIDFDVKPYESIFPDLPISFEHANGHFDLLQTSNKQTIVLKQPFKLKNIHYKDAGHFLLNPFNVTLDFSAKQNKNITRGEIKQFSIDFINDTGIDNAFELQAKFMLDLDKKIPVSELNGKLKLKMTQWLNQPAVIPDNTLSQGDLSSNFSIDKKHHIKHQWLINNLVDKQGETIVKAIAIDGTGQMESLTDFILTLPVIMNSISGQSKLTLNTHTQLNAKKKKISMSIDGQKIFLNDLLKLLAAINPHSEIAQLKAERKEKEKEKEKTEKTKNNSMALDKTPAEKPFWQNGFDISTRLNIETLYYNDYNSYQDIMGELSMTDQQLHAKNFKIKFHDSPMILNALFNFTKNQKKPYDIKFNTSLSQFKIGDFLKELNPEHIPRADGVFDVDIKIYGGLSNLSQFRNELLFNINIEGKNGVYHLIPANDVMMRSSGAALAVVGEIVSLLPTSGFGLGIVSRVIHFAKDIDYDFISMNLIRRSDLNTSIEKFQILSPELRLIATGGLTFKEDTRLFDQPLKMTANLNLAGEGAAIFYGLGLLNNEQDEYGFWKGPAINFSGTLNHQEDNFDEIISQAKSGTLAGGITNPFSGLIGGFKYRWFGDSPDYSDSNKEDSETAKNEQSKALTKKPNAVIEATGQSSFFDETF